MRRPVRRRVVAAILFPVLLAGGAVAVTTLGGEATADSSPALGAAPTLTDRGAASRSVAPARVAAAEAGTLVAPEDCLTVIEDQVTVLRYAGANRYETAVCASFWNWLDHDDPEESPKAQVVVLARGDDFADALAGGPLAGYSEGPLLLTPSGALPADVLTEIQRVLPPGGLVYLLGGPGSISSGIQAELASAGFTTERLAGSNRFETALAIAEELPDTSRFFFATGRNFPDALGAATAAAALSLDDKLFGDNQPYALLLTNDSSMPAAVRDFVIARGQQFGVWTLLTAGGAADRAAVTAFGADSLVARYVGSNRYATATQIAEDIYAPAGVLVGFGAGLATGVNFPDALSASAALARFAEPLLLTEATRLPTPTRTFLQNHAGDLPEGAFLDVFGGRTTVSEPVVLAAQDAFTP